VSRPRFGPHPFADVNAMGVEGEVKRVLAEMRRGKHDNLDPLLPVVYAELQRLAHRQLYGARRDHTLPTSDLEISPATVKRD